MFCKILKNYLNNKYLFLLLTLFIFFSCSAKGSQFRLAKKTPENNKKSIIYIYRLFKHCGYGIIPDIYIDIRKVLELKNDGYTYLSIQPGKHFIVAKRLFSLIKRASVKIDTKPGKSYFIKWSDKCYCGYPYVVHVFTLKLIKKEIALKEILETKFQAALTQ